MSNQLWFSQTTSELRKAWLLKLPPGARMAWVCIKGYVLEASKSQKRPGTAPQVEHESFAIQWNLPPEDVALCLSEAEKAGALIIENGEWDVTDKTSFVSESTLARLKREPKNDLTAFDCQTTSNHIKPRQTTESRSRDSDSDSYSYSYPLKENKKQTYQHANKKTSQKKCVEKPPEEFLEHGKDPQVRIPGIPPWFHGRTDLAARIAQTIAACPSKPSLKTKKPRYPIDSMDEKWSQSACEDLARKLSEFEPTEDEISEFFESFITYHEKPSTKDYVRPVQGMTTFYRNRALQWERAFNLRKNASKNGRSLGDKLMEALDVRTQSR